jgi:hypothetical protein
MVGDRADEKPDAGEKSWSFSALDAYQNPGVGEKSEFFFYGCRRSEVGSMFPLAVLGHPRYRFGLCGLQMIYFSIPSQLITCFELALE